MAPAAKVAAEGLRYLMTLYLWGSGWGDVSPW